MCLGSFTDVGYFQLVHVRFCAECDALSDEAIYSFIELYFEEHNRSAMVKIGYNWQESEGMNWFRNCIEFGIKRFAVKFCIRK